MRDSTTATIPRDSRTFRKARTTNVATLSEAVEGLANVDRALETVVQHWPDLPPSARMAIETIVQAALVTQNHRAVECV